MEVLIKHWYRPGLTWLTALLLPFSYIFRCIVYIRKRLYQSHFLRQYKLTVPVIVVGNITVGGTGKTPLVIWLANFLKENGYQPGIISRGFGARNHKKIYLVTASSPASFAGDEPLLISKKTGCPVVIAKDRVLAAQALIDNHHCDFIISDDGLQHYRLQREIEIAVIDESRMFGNDRHIPAGPLRESPERLLDVDFAIFNAATSAQLYHMHVIPTELRSLNGVSTVSHQAFSGKTVHAVAGIGNPGRFFSLLRNMGMTVIEHAFPDHYHFKHADLIFNDNHPVIMTEKDAVKCQAFSLQHCWVLAIEISPNPEFKIALTNRLNNMEKVNERNSICLQHTGATRF